MELSIYFKLSITLGVIWGVILFFNYLDIFDDYTSPKLFGRFTLDDLIGLLAMIAFNGMWICFILGVWL